MRSAILTLTLGLLTLPACDEPESAPTFEPGLWIAGPPADPDVVRPRGGGDPEAWVVTEWGDDIISTAVFAKHVAVCVATHDPKWTCTLSFRQPNAADPNFVGGLGCSAWFTPELKTCLLKAYQINGAIKIQ